MASTVFELSLRVIVCTLTIASATLPAFADQNSCNTITTCRLGNEKLIIKTTITPGPHNVTKKVASSRYEFEIRNKIAIKRLSDEMGTVTSESTSRAARCGFEESAAVDLSALLDAGEGALVTLVAGETRLTAHRAVLAARSPVFAATLCHGSQGASSEVAVPNVEGPALRQLLAYLYTLQVPQLPGTALQLLAAADKFGLSALKAECEGQVSAQLTVETAAATAVLAVRHSTGSLRRAAIAFIRANLVSVIATQGWADAVRYHPDDVIEVYRLLSERPVESSTPAGTDRQPTTEARSLPHGSQRQTSVADSTASQPTTEARSLPHSSQGQTTYTTSPATQPTAEAQSLPHDGQEQTTYTAAPATQPTAEAQSLPHDGQEQTTYTASPATQLTTEAQSLSTSSHGQTPVATASPLPPCRTASPDNDAVANLRGLSAEEMGQRLIQAAKEGAVEEVEALLAVGADLGTGDARMLTALHWAAYKGHVELVRNLLACGGEVDARTKWQHTPLHLAADGGHLEVARNLLTSGADVDARDGLQNTPLHLTAENGHAAVVQLLLAASADPNATQVDRWTPLLLAAAYGHADVVRLLAASSADPNVRVEQEWTPLHYAADAGHTEVAAALLEAGADKGATADDGRTPLDIARQQNEQQLIDLLT